MACACAPARRKPATLRGRRRPTALVALGLAGMLGGVLGAAAPRDPFAHGATEAPAAGIDFRRRIAWAEGEGRDRAALRRDAVRRLLEVLGPVPVTAGETVAGILASDSAVKSAVEGAAHEAPLTITEEEAGRVRGGVRLSLDGPVIRALLPPIPEERPDLPDGSPRSFTGLVVDARGLPLTPALAPSLLGPEGRVVYGPGLVAEEAAAARGVVGWSASMEEARGSERVGRAPRVVRAVGTRGADLLLLAEDARALSSSHAALAEGRVVIVADRGRLGRPPRRTAQPLP